MTQPTSPRREAGPRKNNTPAFVIAIIGAAASACLLGWALLASRPAAKQRVDRGDGIQGSSGIQGNSSSISEAAMEAANRGVGLMEQFNFEAAAQEFAQARAAAPGWIPARINRAIALLNTATDPNLDAARDELAAVLRDTPQEPHAHFCQGIIALHRNELDVARPHFDAVTKIDPDDASGWYHLGMTLPPGSDEATQCFEEARRLNPNLAAAMHGLAMNLRRSDPARSQQLLADQQALLDVEWDEPLRIRYAEMGKYGEVIAVDNGPKAAWPAAGAGLPKPTVPKFGPATAIGTPRRAVAEPATAGDTEIARLEATFGATVVPVDVDGDDRVDLLLLAGGRPMLYLNRGLNREGDSDAPPLTPRFEEATATAGLPASVDGSVAAAVGDFDNDGRPDLAIASVRADRALTLLRNLEGGRFADVTKPAGLAGVVGPAAGMAWIDLDQDGDLDLVVARRAAAGGTAVLLNIGAAPLAEAGKPPPALEPAFRTQQIDGLSGVAADTIAVSDLDNDRDCDLVLLSGAEPHIAWNDRLLRFHSGTFRDRLPPDTAIPPATSGLVLDADRDGWFDLFMLVAAEPPRVLSLRPAAAEPAAAAAPPLVQAAAVDIDLDGAADIVGLSQAGAAVLLINRGGRFEAVGDAFASGSASAEAVVNSGNSSDLLAAVPADIDGDGQSDLVTLSRSRGLEWRRNLGNGNRALRLVVSGRRERSASLRTNADGVGARVAALAGPVVASMENTTLSASLGQPRQPVVLGLGPATRADVVRIRWPDGVPQAELDVAAGKLVRIEETSRKTTSCPVLFAWDGQGYAFVTDLLGAGVTGEMLPDGTARVPRPHESVLVRPALVPFTGPDGSQQVRLKIAEPFDEVLYLDATALYLIDHPAAWDAVPDERFPGSDPQPTGDTLLLGEPVFARRATDHAGRDITATVAAADGRYAAEFEARSWLGYAEEHCVDLDFGDTLAGFGPDDRIVLELHGWTDYPYPESMWAASQAGVQLLPPTLDRLRDDGSATTLLEIGFPAGLPRVITREITGLVPGDRCRLRIRTSMQIGWDRLAVRPLIASLPRGSGATTAAAESTASGATSGGAQCVRTRLPLVRATLAYRGLARELVAGPSGPIRYDDASRDRVPVTRWQGDFTSAGDIRSRVATDDTSLAICGPGAEVECVFDAAPMPTLPPGWRRSFVLEAAGYTRDTSPLTAGAGSVLPLPE
ncbi:MAG: VCBS repeat-containing protein [Planctomycetes bacterium]|nr:VCBS repeat-containing protein [Planctomycetota bacterium]